MILIILLILAIICILIECFVDHWSTIYLIGSICCTIIITSLIVLSLIAGYGYINKDAKYAELEVRRETLVYQLENVKYENQIELYKKELYDDILEFNKEIISGRVLSKNVLINIFYPVDYNSIKLIEIKGES